MSNNKDLFKLGNKEFNSRMILGSGKYPDDNILKRCINISKTEMITVALRRIDPESDNSDILKVINKDNITIIPNTSGASNSEQAIRIAQICKASGLSDFIKLEIIPEKRYLLPDPIETLKACEFLANKGFHVLPYINSDPVLCYHLYNAGAAAVMPLGSPIGTGKGIKSKENLKIIIEQSKIPVIIDAGIGSPSQACEAMEMGVDAVMLNTAISCSKDPEYMAEAFSLGINAGRKAYKSGLMNQNDFAQPSSPMKQLLEDF